MGSPSSCFVALLFSYPINELTDSFKNSYVTPRNAHDKVYDMVGNFI